MLLLTRYLAQIISCHLQCQWCFLVLYCSDERQWGFLCLFKICDCNPGYPNILTKSSFTFREEHNMRLYIWQEWTQGSGLCKHSADTAFSGQCPFHALSALHLWLFFSGSLALHLGREGDPDHRHLPQLKQTKIWLMSFPSPPLQQ